MAGEVAINTKAYPAYVPQPSGGGTGLIPEIIVADTLTLNAIPVNSIPLICKANVRSTKQIFLTEDGGTTWNAYS